ncbi:MAG: hypothetical protein MJY71_00090 [Bacteroidaceae bacterium]|nr:hypothetical protein [Bacteroidaceae bacterium]
MNNQESSESQELEQLRMEYAEMKARLDRQEIINSNMIQMSINRGVNSIRNNRWIGFPMLLILFAVFYGLSRSLGLRLPFFIVTLVFTAAIVVGNYFRLGRLDSAALSAGPTRQFITEIKCRRVQQLRWIQIMLPLFVLWLGYFILEVMHTGRQGMDLYIIIFSLSVGAATGLFISFRTHNRIIAFYDSIIAQLDLSGGVK